MAGKHRVGPLPDDTLKSLRKALDLHMAGAMPASAVFGPIRPLGCGVCGYMLGPEAPLIIPNGFECETCGAVLMFNTWMRRGDVCVEGEA